MTATLRKKWFRLFNVFWIAVQCCIKFNQWKFWAMFGWPTFVISHFVWKNRVTGSNDGGEYVFQVVVILVNSISLIVVKNWIKRFTNTETIRISTYSFWNLLRLNPNKTAPFSTDNPHSGGFKTLTDDSNESLMDLKTKVDSDNPPTRMIASTEWINSKWLIWLVISRIDSLKRSWIICNGNSTFPRLTWIPGYFVDPSNFLLYSGILRRHSGRAITKNSLPVLSPVLLFFVSKFCCNSKPSSGCVWKHSLNSFSTPLKKLD